MNNQNKATLFIFTALECEAKALINFFELKKDSHNKAFSIYRNSETVLTVTGIGKVAMAGAVAYAMALFAETSLPVMVNIGIAGHKNKPIGSLAIAAKIRDVDSNKVFYPHMLKDNWPKGYEIKTLSKPSSHYDSDCLIEMESSAFYEIAIRFSSSELIHCLKVISDNETSPIDNIGPKLVDKWITNNIHTITQVINDLIDLRNSVERSNIKGYEEIVNQCHFTVTGKIRLQSLLMRWQILSTDSWSDTNKKVFFNSKELLTKLELDVEHLDVIL